MSSDYPSEWPEVNLRTKVEAGFRCVRCHHPNAVYSPPGVDHEHAASVLQARRGSRVRVYATHDGGDDAWLRHWLTPCDDHCTHPTEVPDTGPQAGRDPRKWRILTVHHLDGVKDNLAWWNLAALCQRCHLTIQGKVKLDQTYPFVHSKWFRPYAAGYYAFAEYGHGVCPTRDAVLADMVRFLSLGQPHLASTYRRIMA